MRRSSRGLLCLAPKEYAMLHLKHIQNEWISHRCIVFAAMSRCDETSNSFHRYYLCSVMNNMIYVSHIYVLKIKIPPQEAGVKNPYIHPNLSNQKPIFSPADLSPIIGAESMSLPRSSFSIS